MDALLFLLVPVVVIVLGTVIILLRAREPKGHDRGIRSFQKEMKALSPESARRTMAAAGGDQPRLNGVDPLLGGTIVPRPVTTESDGDTAETGE